MSIGSLTQTVDKKTNTTNQNAGDAQSISNLDLRGGSELAITSTDQGALDSAYEVSKQATQGMQSALVKMADLADRSIDQGFSAARRSEGFIQEAGTVSAAAQAKKVDGWVRIGIVGLGIVAGVTALVVLVRSK